MYDDWPDDPLFPIETSYVRKYNHVEAVCEGRVVKKKRKSKKEKEENVVEVATEEVKEVVKKKERPDRVLKTGVELWAMLKKAYNLNFFHTIRMCELLKTWLDELMYNIYSHFLGTRRGIVFSMPAGLKNAFEEKFFTHFRYMLTKDEESGDYEIKRSPPSVVTLQQDFDEWCERVCTPMLNLANALTGKALSADAKKPKPEEPEPVAAADEG